MSGVAWVVPTTTHLKDYLVAAQVTALQTAALSGGSDPFSAVMPDVVARIRASIRSCKANMLSETANSVPPELKWVACILILEQMQTRLPSLAFSDSQKKIAEDAGETLKAVSKCELVVSLPTNPTDGYYQTGAAAVIATSSNRKVTRDLMKGL